MGLSPASTGVDRHHGIVEVELATEQALHLERLQLLEQSGVEAVGLSQVIVVIGCQL